MRNSIAEYDLKTINETERPEMTKTIAKATVDASAELFVFTRKAFAALSAQIAPSAALTLGKSEGSIRFGNIATKAKNAITASCKCCLDVEAFTRNGNLALGGVRSVTDVFPFADCDHDRLLMLAASAEAHNLHPTGMAIVSAAISEDLPIKHSSKFTSTAGRGVAAETEGHRIICGNRKHLSENGITLSRVEEEHVNLLHSQGKTVILVADESKCLGAIALSEVYFAQAE